MAQRKVFTDENGVQLNYYLFPHEQLVITLTMENGTISSTKLDKTDALSFIQELNKLRKELQ